MDSRPKRKSPPRTRIEERGSAARLNLFDPRRGDEAFRLQHPSAGEMSRPQRSNYFTVLWIQTGQGMFHTDSAEYPFAGPALLFLNPYQMFFLEEELPVTSARLEFHANFFCIETHHQAVGCNGVLFNDVYGPSVLALDEGAAVEFASLIAQMEVELRTTGLAHTEALVSYLKVFLIKATRLKVEQLRLGLMHVSDRPAVLQRLSEMIEEQYCHWHTPGEYAGALHMAPRSLGKLVKAHFGKTLTELIRERVLRHAKWQLLHTRRPVKEIAWEVGYSDEFYFSRVFKRAIGCAPAVFREYETAIRGGRNLPS